MQHNTGGTIKHLFDWRRASQVRSAYPGHRRAETPVKLTNTARPAENARACVRAASEFTADTQRLTWCTNTHAHGASVAAIALFVRPLQQQLRRRPTNAVVAPRFDCDSTAIRPRYDHSMTQKKLTAVHCSRMEVESRRLEVKSLQPTHKIKIGPTDGPDMYDPQQIFVVDMSGRQIGDNCYAFSVHTHRHVGRRVFVSSDKFLCRADMSVRFCRR